MKWLLTLVLLVTLAVSYFYLTTTQFLVILGFGLFFLFAVWSYKKGDPIIFRMGGLKWTQRELCTGFYVQGGTGTGKTTSFINPFITQLMETVPNFGCLAIGVKGDEGAAMGVLVESMRDKWEKTGIGVKHIDINVKPRYSDEDWKPKYRWNLLGDNNIKPATYAAIISSTIAAVTSGSEQKFFQESAKQTLADTIELLRLIDIQPNLKLMCEMYLDTEKLSEILEVAQERLAIMEDEEKAGRLNLAYRGLYDKFMSEDGKDQAKGEKATVSQILTYFKDKDISDVFSPEPLTDEEIKEGYRDVDITAVSRGVIITVSMSQDYTTTRVFINNFLKCLFYQHAKERFDITGSGIKKAEDLNLLVGLYDEAQQILTNTDDGYAEKDVFAVTRSAGVCFVCATQSYASFIDKLKSKDPAKVVVTNLRNKISFRVDDIDSQEILSTTLGEKKVRKKSYSISQGRKTVSFSEAYEPVIHKSVFANLGKQEAVVVHGSQGKHKKTKLKPIYPKR